VVGSAAGDRAVVHAEIGDQPVRPAEDAVEREHRPARGEARHGIGRLEQRRQPLERRIDPARPPFVEVAAEQRRHRFARLEMGAQALHLQAAGAAQQAEVGGDDAQAAASDVEFGQHRAARLGMRQVKALGAQHGAAPVEQGVAVPAVAHRPGGQRHQRQAGFLFQRDEVEPALAVAQPAVGFLQGDDVGVDLGDHRDGAGGVVGAVVADGLMDIVAGDANEIAAVAGRRDDGGIRRLAEPYEAADAIKQAGKAGKLPGHGVRASSSDFGATSVIPGISPGPHAITAEWRREKGGDDDNRAGRCAEPPLAEMVVIACVSFPVSWSVMFVPSERRPASWTTPVRNTR